MTNNIIDKVRAEINRRIHNIIRTPEEEEELKRNFPDQYGVVLGYRAVLSILDLFKFVDEQKPNYCHHEVDLSNCSEEYRKAYYDGWNNCNQQHSQLRAEQKPAWSEEDESRMDNLCHFLEEYGNQYYGHLTLQGTISWLKSLRPQNWTKEDKERYISCLQRLSTGNPEQPETINSKWFKEHVYPQATWKPSEEQIKALSYYLKNDIDNDGVFGRQLVKLYQDLLKLREE